MEEQEEKYLFEEMTVPKAVATLAVPTIISQVVTMIYNLADTFFVGQLGDPAMVAAVSLVSPWFNLLTALGTWLARRPLLGFLGASPDTWPYAQSYLLWVVAVGGVPTMVSLALGHLLRSEGHARQAMGKGVQSAILTFSRQGLLNIPLLILMDLVFGLYGMIWTQLVVEVIMLPVSLGMYFHTFRSLQTPARD